MATRNGIVSFVAPPRALRSLGLGNAAARGACIPSRKTALKVHLGSWLCENSGLFRKRRKTFSIRAA